MRKTKPLELTALEREKLEKFISTGTALVRHLKHAQVLLKLAEGWSNQQVAQAFDVSQKTVITLRKRFLTEGLDATLKDKPRSGAPRRIDGAVKAVVVATACSTAPAGHARWTLRLLADKLVELEVVEGISPTTVGDILKKTN